MDNAAQSGATRVLIVDDDPDIHEFLAIALKGAGYHIENAYDGLEGLRKIESAPWDLVISDVLMPGMEGLELLERVRAIRPALPVLIMTVDSTAERILSAIRDHAFAWLPKPFTRQAALELVDSALTVPRLEGDIEVISASPQWLELRIRCDINTARRALHFLRGLEHRLPEAELDGVAQAFREILFNAVEHGGGNNPDVHVTITYTRLERAVMFRVRDPGPGFSFENLRHAAVSYPADSPLEHMAAREALGMRLGGFGIMLTRQLVDELVYNQKGNEVLLVKYIDRARTGPAGTTPG